MDIRSSLDGLKSLLGVTASGAPATQKPRSGAASETSLFTADLATLSNAGSEVSQSAELGDVRMAKVAEIRSVLQAGTYEVSASAVASKMVDAMLERGK